MYRFKGWEELGWFIAVAVATVVLQGLVSFDPAAIEDWRTWAVSLGAAAVRAAAGAVLAYLGRAAVTGQEGEASK